MYNIDSAAQLEARKTPGISYTLRAFFLSLLLAFVVFIPFIVLDGGRFIFYGDFNVQQINFYRIAHDAVRDGNMGWSHLTDLGANFVGSYSFYLLGSPFFWLTIPFPGEWIQYLMGPLLILKFACASTAGYIYLRRYVRNRDYAIMGGILYAFSGFSVYNIFFNHFHEAIVFFPILIYALDEYMYKRRRGLFALAVGTCCIVNYYFFVGMVVFTAIYFFVRLACGSWKINFKDFSLLAFEAVLGFSLSFVLLVPSVLAVLQNERVDNPIGGWNALIYSNSQRYVHLLQCLFFPPDLPARPNFTPDSNAKWSSLGAWLPLFSMTGVIGWLQLHRKHWLKKMLWILFIMALVPGLNASFQLFNASFYTRWFYMLTLMMSMATVMAIEEKRVNWRRSIKWTALITGVMAIAIGFVPVENTDKSGKTSWSFGLEDYPTRFWTYTAVAFVCLALLAAIFTYFKDDRKKFTKAILSAVCIVSVVWPIFFIGLGKSQSSDPYEHLIPYALNDGEDVDIDGLDTVRSDFYDSLDNSGMFWKIPTIQAFHSIVPGSVMEFYEFIGVERSVGSRPGTDHYAVRGLTSTRWLFDDDDDDAYFAGEDFDTPLMPGWMFYGNANGFDIYENAFYVPMGFSYDSYLTRSEAETLSKERRELVMLKTLIVEDDKEAEIAAILPHYEIENAVFTETEYQSDCIDRSRVTCNRFAYNNKGFTAGISTKKETVVFFSVPSENGWKAYVNGAATQIYKANVGFMAIVVPAGDEVKINFTYNTPGLGAGGIVSSLAAVAFIVYMIIVRVYRYRKSNMPPKEKKQIFVKRYFRDYQKTHKVKFELRTPAGGLRQPQELADEEKE